MTRQFNRNGRLILQHPSTAVNDWFGRAGNQITIDGLRIQFSIELSLTKSPNHADVTITNLNKASRSEFQQKPLVVRIEAGYAGEYQHLFTGDLRYGSSQLNPPDWETKLQLADGDRAFRNAKINKSYSAKVPVLQALKDVAGAMGQALPPEIGTNGLLTQFQAEFQTGNIVEGSARDEMTRLLAPFGCTWSFQNGKLQILRSNDLAPNEALVLSAASGLKGSPEVGVPERGGTKKGDTVTVKAKMTLKPELYPGMLVHIESHEVKGNFKLTKVTHKGDTHGDAWDTEIEGKAV